MKKRLLLVLRLLIAAAGIIVVSGNVNLSQPTGPLQILIGPPDDDPTRSPVTMTLTEAMLAAENGPFNLQPGIATMLRSARPDYLVYGLLLLALVYPLVTYRLLLRVRGMAASTLYLESLQVCVLWSAGLFLTQKPWLASSLQASQWRARHRSLSPRPRPQNRNPPLLQFAAYIADTSTSTLRSTTLRSAISWDMDFRVLV